MAVTFQLIRNAATLNLASGVDAGWRARTWHPRVAALAGNRMPPLVTETVDFMVDEDTHNNLSTAFQNLDAYRWWAREYIQDRTQQYPVWWQVKMDAETGTRQALVYDLGLQWASEEADEDGQWICQSQALARATIIRGPFWERTAATTAGTGSGLSILGGAFDYTAGGGADVVGDAPARISYLNIEEQTDGYDQYWIGFRSAPKHGTLANFVPLWQFEAGTLGTDAALAADATASPGGGGNTKVTVSFATVATWMNRLTWALNDISANESDQYGRYAIFCRAKISAGTVAEIRLFHGSGGPDTVYSPIVEVADTAWHMYSLGYMTIPHRDLHMFPLSLFTDTYDLEDRFVLQARRTSGAGTLDLDCMVLIPADELFLHVLDVQGTATYPMYVAQAPENLWQAVLIVDAGTDYIGSVAIVAPEGIGVPLGDGRMYLTGADINGRNTFSGTYDAALSLFPRWYNLRGSE